MKKMMLNVEQLSVSSFAVDAGEADVPAYVSEQTQCLCTREAGCYPSKYCSGASCVITYQEGCMTNNYVYC